MNVKQVNTKEIKAVTINHVKLYGQKLAINNLAKKYNLSKKAAAYVVGLV